MNAVEGHCAGEEGLGTHGMIHELPMGSLGPTCWSGGTAVGVVSMHHGLHAAYELGQD